MLLRDVLFFAAERFPDREAIVEGDRRLTYRELADMATCIAGSLTSLGVNRGDRVAVGMRNTLDHVAVFFACQLLGAGIVPFNIRMEPEGVSYIIQDSGARVAIVDDAIDIEAVRKEPGIPAEMIWIEADENRAEIPGVQRLSQLASSSSSTSLPDLTEDDLSTIIYTSGTTGRPKGVPISQRNAYSRTISYFMTVGPLFDSGARTLGIAPLYHTVGMHYVFLLTMVMNGTYYPVPKLSKDTLQLVRDEEMTFVFASPTALRILLEGGGETPTPSVTHAAYGSAPVGPELIAEVCDAFPNALVSEVYGSTEISIPFVTPSVREVSATGALRQTGDHLVRIVTPGGGPDDVVAPGEIGELLVHRGNRGVFTRYWGPGGDAKCEEKCVGDWYRTSDAFRYDEDGNFFCDGRLDDIFICGGENIQPAEVENVISGMPGVVDCAVLGWPDQKWTNIISALIVTDGREIDLSEVDEFCKQSALENYKRPRKVSVVDRVPRNPSGKIVRPEAFELFRASVEAAEAGAASSQDSA